MKRTSVYQDYCDGGLRMVDIELTTRALRLAWIRRLLFNEKSSWKTIPEHFFSKQGGLNFLLRWNYDVEYLGHIPTFYKDILIAFDEIKALYNYDQGSDTILFNNRQILVDGKPVFLKEWFNKGIYTIQKLLNEDGQYLTYKEFQMQYRCRSNFLEFYQIINAIPPYLKHKARNPGQNPMPNGCENWALFELDEASQIDLQKLKAREYYRLLLVKKHQSFPTGPERWSKDFAIDREGWRGIFRVVPKLCNDSKLKEFQYILLHRIAVTKKNYLGMVLIQTVIVYIVGNPAPLTTRLSTASLQKNSGQQVVDWFNAQNDSEFLPNTQQMLFATFKNAVKQVLKM